MAHDVFITYSSQDRTTAYAMCATLEAKRIRCWIAPRDVLAGMNYAEALMEAIGQSRVMVLVFSSHSNRSQQVINELETAVNRGIPILPFRVEDVPPSGPVEFYIRSRHWLDAWTPPLQRHLDQLAETVGALLSRAGTPPVVSREPEPPTREPAAPSPVLVALGAAGRGLLRQGLAGLRVAGRLLRYTAATVVRRPLPSALAAAGICAVILVALAVIAMQGGGGKGSDDGQGGAVALVSTTTTAVTTNTPKPAATPSVAGSKPTAAPKTPASTQVGAAAMAAPPMGKADKFSIVAAPDCVAPDGRIEATWTAITYENSDVIAVFSTAAADDQPADYEYEIFLRQTVGGRVFLPAPFAPGEYEVRLVRHSSTKLAASNPITVQDGCPFGSTAAQLEGYTTVAGPNCVAPGGRVEATWTEADKKVNDVIALIAVAAKDDQYSDYEYQDLRTAGGSIFLTASSTPGEYEVRLVRDLSIHMAVSDPITVREGCPSTSPATQTEGYTLAASPSCVAPGGTVEATWTAIGEVLGDTIAMLPVAATDNEFLDYKQQWEWVNTVGGSISLTAPNAPGEYDVRLLRDDTHLAVSQPITVSKDCP